ncbi:hypothetical protein FGW84_00685, partial [Xylella fastidiosa subsp. multiplex]|uniref:hemerythrin domain-containing protein n=1 Tax=Xylella fastidiosa TaxID=2371 RepID=UPI00139FC8E3
LFTAYDELVGSKAASATAKKRQLAQQICAELTVHTQIEEEIFYPAVREAIKETDLLDEAVNSFFTFLWSVSSRLRASGSARLVIM